VVIVQIEHIDAVNNLEPILEVDGVDGIIVGPYDLSASLGKPGKFDDAEIIDALKRIEEVSSRYNKSLGYHVINPSHHDVMSKVNQEYNFIAFSLDFFFLGDKVRGEMHNLRQKLK
jgi:2-dehydro-3-deoxyglucarate aldolase